MRASFAVLLAVTVCAPGVLGEHAAPFKNKLAHVQAAHDTAWHDRLKAQIAAAPKSSSMSSSKASSSVSTSAKSTSAAGTTSKASGTTSTASPTVTLHDAVATDTNNGTSPFADGSTTSFTLYDSSSLPNNPAPPAACATALEATIACNSTVPLMGAYDFLFQDATDLDPVCTTACNLALAAYRANIVKACGTFQMVDSLGNTYAPTLAIDSILSSYDEQCLYDSTQKQYCAVIVSNYTATDDLLSLPTNQLCSYCTLESMNVTVSNPATFSYPLQDLLHAAVTKCGSSYSQYDVTAAPSAPLAPASTSTFGVTSPTPDAQCQYIGTNVSVTTNTTCAALAATYKISPADVWANNPAIVDASCNITAPATLCIPPACTLYTIKANDTCDTVSAQSLSLTGTHLSMVQLTSINPELGIFCQSMAALVGSSICLSPNGGWPSVGVTTTALPEQSPTAVAPIPVSTGPGSTSKCGRWYLTQAGDNCNGIVISQGITLTDFLTINPEVNTNCTNLWLGYNYCVAPYPALTASGFTAVPTGNFTSGTITNIPLPTANYTVTWHTQTLDPVGIPAPTNLANGTKTLECGYYYDVQKSDTLASIAKTVQMSAADLQTWNPQLVSSAPVAGSAICVRFPTGNYTLATAPPPGNAAQNSTTNCAQWYTVVTGDGCPSIESKFGLTSAQFSQLNPSVNAACTTLQLGAAYCVLSIHPTGSTTTPAPTGPPSNLASGSFTNCTSYHTVASGDTCNTMEVAGSISATDLLRWNPEVNVLTCTNIQLGAAYCVGGGGTQCSKRYTVVSGDYCSKVETAVGLSDAQLRSYNPWLDSGCSLQVGMVLCVGPSSTITTTTTSSSSTSTTLKSTTTPLTTTTTSTTTSKSTTTSTSIGSVPTNLASSSWKNCTSYYNVVSGDNCNAIDSKYTISFSDFVRWNPSINPTCSNLGLNSYCVKASPACKKIYTVASGDYCSKIETAQGISDATLRSLNPWMDANCDIQPAQNLCVG